MHSTHMTRGKFRLDCQSNINVYMPMIPNVKWKRGWIMDIFTENTMNGIQTEFNRENSNATDKIEYKQK